MHSRRHRNSILSSTTALILGFSALTTQAEDFELDTLVITPSRTPTEASKVGSTVEIIERDEIEEQSLPLVQDYLNQLPGLNLSPNGGPGNTTTLIMRGLRGQYVKTLFEGIAACVEAAGGSAIASPDGRAATDDFDLIIAVIGETPYAEGQGVSFYSQYLISLFFCCICAQYQ